MSSCATYRKIVSGEAEGLGASLARGALGLLSKPYSLAASLTEIARAGQEAVDVGLPVISVGNITAGGTGKTPFVAFVVAELLARKRRPVVLSRGYCAGDDGKNDEAKVLARLFPGVIHLQGKDRVASARHAADARLGDVLVMDDGFQYQALARRLNVCCIDATNPFGYGKVLPAGLLREPLSVLYRARPVVITRAELSTPAAILAIQAGVRKHNPYAKFVVTEMKPVAFRDVFKGGTCEPSSLDGHQVLLASGVGNPESFVRDVRRLGARVREHVEKRDHHDWTQAEVTDLARKAKTLGVQSVVTTAKDAVKLAALTWPADAPPLGALDIEVSITGGADVWKALLDEALA
jgi:tetraacyldisaccharide 4'-kinase